MSDKEIEGHQHKIKIDEDLYFNTGQNVLCNYMKRAEYLKMILKNRAIIPRYVEEKLGYLNLGNCCVESICFPMTCFCDIPFTKASKHMMKYGNYGIGLKKKSLLKNNMVQPVHYVNEKSSFCEDFKDAFEAALANGEEENQRELTNFLLTSLMYMKPIFGYENDENNEQIKYVYQDESEWRYVPQDFPDDIPQVLLPNYMSRKIWEKHSEVLVNHQECWLKFEWTDVEYLIVPDGNALEEFVDFIRGMDIKDKDKDILISKIELKDHFSDYG